MLSGYPYLLVLMEIWTENRKKQFKNMNTKVDEENRRATEMGKEKIRKVWWFSIN